MADAVCQVIRKFDKYNTGEKISASDAQIATWEEQKLVVRIPAPDVPQMDAKKAPVAPPVNKMISVAEEAKGEDETPSRRGPGRPRARDE